MLWGPSRHLGSLTAANWVSFDFNVSCSSCWGYSLINTFKFKKKKVGRPLWRTEVCVMRSCNTPCSCCVALTARWGDVPLTLHEFLLIHRCMCNMSHLYLWRDYSVWLMHIVDTEFWVSFLCVPFLCVLLCFIPKSYRIIHMQSHNTESKSWQGSNYFNLLVVHYSNHCWLQDLSKAAKHPELCRG